jgi:hypothetical protein
MTLLKISSKKLRCAASHALSQLSILKAKCDRFKEPVQTVYRVSIQHKRVFAELLFLPRYGNIVRERRSARAKPSYLVCYGAAVTSEFIRLQFV